jgi:hypothetical protein
MASAASNASDLFSGLFDHHPSKLTSIAFSVVASPVNIVLAFGVVWFEKYATNQVRQLGYILSTWVGTFESKNKI